MTLLSVQQVSKTYQLRLGWSGKTQLIHALQDVSIDLVPGSCLGVVGESGAGKSTLGRMVLGLEKPDRGQIWFQDKELSQLTPPQLRSLRRDIQVVFQDSFNAVNPRFKVREIISEPIRNYLNLTAVEVTNRTVQLLETVGLTAADADKYPHQFSGGQLQRVTIARAIALKPKLVVLDEPVSSLDMTIQAQILNLLLELKQQFHLSYLFITHDLAAVAYLADRFVIMHKGAIVESSDSLDLSNLQHPYSRQLIAAQLPAHPRDRKSFLYAAKP
ncbi:dipeptide/oligopeptide/nickel ABC transporter ATP-binding protein [Leptolyngbya sp. O-77]|uniref:ATP-binding cassette domain-containing protein n=1 Tax=Leptolyngbya sp. O-77 TaxID=1080068 RepID=UPI00074D2A6E|nr:dipeptide/oligopeptide/nickel ABC transporter ATP-binding protein [Leptolyngbya sp. O-77]BAU40305.1 Nickel import ATP-binding protein NikE [Leptolyngbya sp. O-77]